MFYLQTEQDRLPDSSTDADMINPFRCPLGNTPNGWLAAALLYLPHSATNYGKRVEARARCASEGTYVT